VEGYGNTGDTGYFATYTAHYLEAAPASAITGTFQWGAYGSLISGVTSFTSSSNADAAKIGNGRKDTALIAAHLGTSESNRAAQICASLTTGGTNDWFLPSLGELHELYQQRTLSGISITTGRYWSSSQYNGSYAWNQIFDSDLQDYPNKAIGYSVRAIRAF